MPLFQNESSCKTLSYENEFDLHENEPVEETHFYIESFRTRTRSDTEVKSNLEVSYYSRTNTKTSQLDSIFGKHCQDSP